MFSVSLNLLICCTITICYYLCSFFMCCILLFSFISVLKWSSTYIPFIESNHIDLLLYYLNFIILAINSYIFHIIYYNWMRIFQNRESMFLILKNFHIIIQSCDLITHYKTRKREVKCEWCYLTFLGTIWKCLEMWFKKVMLVSSMDPTPSQI